MRTILLALLLGFIGSNVHAVESHQEAAVQAAPCATASCAQPVRSTARFVLAAPARVAQAGVCAVRNAVCAVKNVACNVRSRVRSRVSCRQSRRARFFSRRSCCN